MLLGKRPRPPIMRRTTSMSGMSVETEEHSDAIAKDSNAMMVTAITPDASSLTSPHEQRFINTNAYTNQIQNQTMETPHFLRTCGLCKRRLAPGRDIYMYRGDTAFCSLECREQQMKQDERKDKWKLGSNSKKEEPQPRPRASSPTATATSNAGSTKSETIAAA